MGYIYTEYSIFRSQIIKIINKQLNPGITT